MAGCIPHPDDPQFAMRKSGKWVDRHGKEQPVMTNGHGQVFKVIEGMDSIMQYLSDLSEGDGDGTV